MSYGNNNGYGNRQGASGYRGNTGGGGNRQFTPRTQAQGQGQAQRKDNTGSMRRNTEKQNDKQPDYKGSVLVAGRLYFISGWDNGDYYKLALTPADEANQSRPQSAPSRGGYPQQQQQQQGNAGNFGEDMDLNDQVPF